MTEEPNEHRARHEAASPLPDATEGRPKSSLVRVEIGARSHRGAVQSSNEDHYLVVRLGRQQETLLTSLSGADVPEPFDEYGYAMLVADGLGDTGAGAAAGRVALSTLAHLAIHFGKWNLRVDARTAGEIKERAEWFHRRVDDAVVAQSRTHVVLAGMATTLTAAYSAGDDLFIAHVGHSRAYLFRDGHLTQLTRDHTMAWHTTGTSRPARVSRATQDLQHILTDTIGGVTDGPIVDVDHIRLANGDQLLLCTNGLTDMVTDEKIAEALSLRRGAVEQCQLLVDLALQAGGEDNVTVTLAEYQIPESPR